MTRDLDAHRVAQHIGPEPIGGGQARWAGFWIGLVVALIVLVGIVVYGIHARSKADTDAGGGYEAGGDAGGEGDASPQPGWERYGCAGAAGKYACLMWIRRSTRGPMATLSEVVLRYRRACEEGTADGDDRDAGAGPATAGGAGRFEGRAGESRIWRILRADATRIC